MTEPADFLKPHIEALHQRGRLRVWSLVVTIMGDVVVPRGKLIAMADLLELTGHMGIEPGALRTAMSRLSKEGWVKGSRSGRVSHYGFGEVGLADYEPAAQRIYSGPSSVKSGRWRLRLYNSETDLNSSVGVSAIQVAPGIILSPSSVTEQKEAAQNQDPLSFSVQVETVPGWIKKRITPKEAVSAYNNLSARVGSLVETVRDPEPLDAMVARILVIHEWRRLVLRYPVPPLEFQPKDRPAESARRMVQAVYEMLLPPSQAFWGNSASDEELTVLSGRFKNM